MLSLNRDFLGCNDFVGIAPAALWCEGEEGVDYVVSRNYYEWYLSYPVRLRRPTARILEIGIRYGYSAVAMLMGALRRSRFVEYWGFDDGSYGVSPHRQPERIEGLLGQTNVGVVITKANTQAMDRLNGTAGRFDIIHVDGAHTDDAGGEAHDLRLVAPLLQSGGIIIVDDATDGRPSMMEVIPSVADELGLNWVYAPTYRGHIVLFSGELPDVFDLPLGSVDGRIPKPGMVRNGTLDRYIYDEVVYDNTYRLNDRIRGGTVVDVGAHIGFFSEFCLSMGAAFVDAYEANPDNFAFGRERMASISESALRYRNLAVWSEANTTIEISVDDGINTGSSSVMVEGTNRIPVQTITLDGIVAELNRPIDLLKLDCEGAEYPIIYGSDLSSVRNIVGEFHPFTADDGAAGGVVRRIRPDIEGMIDRANGGHFMGYLRDRGFRTWHHPGGLFAATRDDDPPLSFDFS